MDLVVAFLVCMALAVAVEAFTVAAAVLWVLAVALGGGGGGQETPKDCKEGVKLPSTPYKKSHQVYDDSVH